MRRLFLLLGFPALLCPAQQPFTLQQVLSAPYALSLTASPVGARFAWVENAEGRRNIWVGGPNEPAHALTLYTEDDGQDLAALTWSGDGKMLAFTRGAETGAGGRPANPAHLQRPTPVEIFVSNLTGDPVRVAEGRSPRFTRDGKSILFVRGGQIWMTPLPLAKPVAKSGVEQRGLLEGVAALVGSVPTPEMAKQLVFDRGSASGLTLSPDGTLLAYISHRRTHSLLALFNLETHALSFPAASTGNDSAPSFSPDGHHVAWLREPFTDFPEFAAARVSANPWSVQVMDLLTGEARTLFAPEANKPGSVIPRMSTGEPRVFYTSNYRLLFFSEADGWVHLYSVNPSAPRNAVQLLTPGKFEVEDVTVSRDGRRVVYASNGSPEGAPGSQTDVDRRHLWEIDLTAAAPAPVAMTYKEFYGNIDTHPALAGEGSGELAFIDSSPDLPPYAAMAEPRGGGIMALHRDAVPEGYPEHLLVTPTQVIFPSAGTAPLQIHGQLFLPTGGGAGKRPAILFVHGGPKRQMLLGYPTMDYYSDAYAMNEYLVSRGYVVLSINYRCGIGYGLEFRQCEHAGADGAMEYNDVLGAAAFLRARTDVDTARIGIWGGSYGGYLTALALARNSDLFAAGVDFHGVHEWAVEDNAPEDWLHGPTWDRSTVPVEVAAMAHASSPMADVAKWRSPVLLIHGDDDPEVAYAQTPMLADALRARNVHVEELVLPDEVHDFILHKSWLAAYTAAAEFFDRMLKPAAVPVK